MRYLWLVFYGQRKKSKVALEWLIFLLHTREVPISKTVSKRSTLIDDFSQSLEERFKILSQKRTATTRTFNILFNLSYTDILTVEATLRVFISVEKHS